MKTISKFHIGMLRASALSVLNAIATENYKAVVVKAAKLKMLAVKLDISLLDALPPSVIKVIKSVLGNIFHATCNNAVCALWFNLQSNFGTTKEAMDKIASLIVLPKVPALR